MSVRALVDTGSAYLVLTPDLVSQLGLHETPYDVELTLADRRKVKTRLYLAEVEVKDRRGPAFVAAVDVPSPLLGIYALETLGLKPNPATGEIEVIGPEGGYLLSATRARHLKRFKLTCCRIDLQPWKLQGGYAQ